MSKSDIYKNILNSQTSVSVFLPALMWLMYDGTKKDDYKITAERAEELLDFGLFNFEGTDHDVVLCGIFRAE